LIINHELLSQFVIDGGLLFNLYYRVAFYVEVAQGGYWDHDVLC
jgi:hypothetical protein